MSNRLSWFYRISLGTVAAIILTYILVKIIIWIPALADGEGDQRFVIKLYKHAHYIYNRHTTEFKGRIFNAVDYLFRPAVVMLFVVITVRLINTKKLLEEE
jgi:hypothetical protein